MLTTHIVSEGVKDGAGLVKLAKAATPEEHPWEIEFVSDDPVGVEVKVTERSSGLVRTHRVPTGVFEAVEYRKLVEAQAKLVSLVGVGPFHITLGENEDEAKTYAELRETIMSLAQKGSELSRFKGLGEMNPEQLRETTMDPESRTLMQVQITDEVEAKRLFSTLMGDLVEPRRDFIETHAREVANLDV
jgi:DNA gyrase subunit B